MASRDARFNLSDAATLAGLGERIAQHRLARNWTQAHLAEESGVSTRTLVRLEAGESIQSANLIRVLRVLGLLANLDQLVPPSTPSPLEQLRAADRPRRQRASGSRSGSEPELSEPWRWGDEGAGGES